MVHRLGAGVYDYLPLGWRALRKAMQIVREEMDRIGAAEVLLPTIQPVELWEQTGRRDDYGENLFVLTDRHGREQALGPTHEEVVTELIRSCVSSYRQLPLTLYQIQTKFRDEFRPRFGVVRSREFQMKDAYSFHTRLDSLDETYDAMYGAYRRIFERCGVPYRVVDAESGPIGGSASHEFMIPAPTGEDTILVSDRGDYAANVEKAVIGSRPVNEAFGAVADACGFAPASFAEDADPTGELEDLHTPDCPGLEDVIAHFRKALKSRLKRENMLKTLVCQHEGGWVVAVVRGDHELNLGKLSAACGVSSLQLADEAAARDAGFAIGFVGPHVVHDHPDATLVVDPDATRQQFWVTGANEVDHHVRHFHWKRDVLEPLGEAASERVRVADIRNAEAGDPSPNGDGALLEKKGIEVGHIFKLGTKYSTALEATVLNEDNERVPVVMGCYGIGINRILAGAIECESGHDEDGIVWPRALAPFDVLVTPIKFEGRVREVCEKLASELSGASESADANGGHQTFDVLLDDRDERPGVKFKDADLIGVPLRVTVGEKSLADGVVELKMRDGSIGSNGETVEVEHAAARCHELLER